MDASDEIKTFLMLHGMKTRLPDLEAEIFADESLTTMYLHSLNKDRYWYDVNHSNPCLVYYYTKNVINGRWPEAEPIIATIPGYVITYARNIIKARWYEAEHILKADSIAWNMYSRIFNIAAHNSTSENN